MQPDIQLEAHCFMDALTDDIFLEIMRYCIFEPLSASRVKPDLISHNFDAVISLQLVNKRFETAVNKIIREWAGKQPEVKNILQEIIPLINDKILNMLPLPEHHFMLPDNKNGMQDFWDSLINTLKDNSNTDGLNLGAGYYAFPAYDNKLFSTKDAPIELYPLMESWIDNKVTGIVFLLEQHKENCKKHEKYSIETKQEATARKRYFEFSSQSKVVGGGLKEEESDKQNHFIFSSAKLRKHGSLHHISLHTSNTLPISNSKNDSQQHPKRKLSWLYAMGLVAVTLGVTTFFVMNRNKLLSYPTNLSNR